MILNEIFKLGQYNALKETQRDGSVVLCDNLNDDDKINKNLQVDRCLNK